MFIMHEFVTTLAVILIVSWFGNINQIHAISILFILGFR